MTTLHRYSIALKILHSQRELTSHVELKVYLVTWRFNTLIKTQEIVTTVLVFIVQINTEKLIYSAFKIDRAN